MDIENLDLIIDKFIEKKVHRNINPLAPQHPFRAVIVGPSGGGKTNLCLNLILKYLCYDKIYIYAKDISEEKYKFLIAYMQAIEDQYNQINGTTEKIVEFSSNLDDVSIDAFDPTKQNLVIFDDMITESKQNQKVIDEAFIRGRKTPNCSLMYLTQSFFNTPPLLRSQCNYIILMNVGSAREIQELSKTYASDLSYKELKELYKECVQKPYGFMVIDLKTTQKVLKYRCGFDSLYVPKPDNDPDSNF